MPTIDPVRAESMRRIYREYAEGTSPCEIAASLNRDCEPPPRDSTWAMTAIYGKKKHGIGILSNSKYIGRQMRNRSRWIKHPYTGLRIRQERPESEWITPTNPSWRSSTGSFGRLYSAVSGALVGI